MIECRAIAVLFGNTLVLQDVDVSVCAGECLWIIGPNGAGKSTLLKVMAGLLAPGHGSVRIGGRAAADLSARERGRQVAYLPQSIEQLPALSVTDVVAAGRYPYVPPLAPLSPGDWRAVEEALRLCGLADLAQRPLNQVSGGERQNALLAAGFAQDAQTLLLDEPATGLDPRHQSQLVALLRQWLRRGRALVAVSHDLQIPVAMGGRVLALRGGRAAAAGPVADVLTPGVLARIYDSDFSSLRGAAGQQTVGPSWWGAAPCDLPLASAGSSQGKR